LLYFLLLSAEEQGLEFMKNKHFFVVDVRRISQFQNVYKIRLESNN